MKYTIVDLFAGAGGLTAGFHLAGFKSLCAIDINKKSLITYKYNFPTTKIIPQDIITINPVELRQELGIKKEELTALIGGPPCQGFSRNTPAGSRYLHEPRNQLYQTFIEFVKEFRPLHVVIENVPEILKAYDGAVKNEIIECLGRIGYKVTSASLNAAYYGVPQTRARAFFLSSLDQILQIPEHTHYGDIRSDFRSDRVNNRLSLLTSSRPLLTVRDAIGDLPLLNAGQEYTNECYPSSPQTEYQIMVRCGSKKLVNHVARTHIQIWLPKSVNPYPLY